MSDWNQRNQFNVKLFIKDQLTQSDPSSWANDFHRPPLQQRASHLTSWGILINKHIPVSQSLVSITLRQSTEAWDNKTAQSKQRLNHRLGGQMGPREQLNVKKSRSWHNGNTVQIKGKQWCRKGQQHISHTCELYDVKQIGMSEASCEKHIVTWDEPRGRSGSEDNTKEKPEQPFQQQTHDTHFAVVLQTRKTTGGKWISYLW